jgi:hypothetical protein
MALTAEQPSAKDAAGHSRILITTASLHFAPLATRIEKFLGTKLVRNTKTGSNLSLKCDLSKNMSYPVLSRPILVSAVICALMLTGCAQQSAPATSEEKGITFAKNSIRFDCPAGWSITADKQTSENERLAICEKSGDYESGLFIAKWTTTNVPELTMLEQLQNYYQETYGNAAGVEIDFEKINQKKNSVEYSFTANGVKHRGWIEIKKCPGAMVGLFFQYAKVDYGRYKEALGIIKSSFGCLD